MCLSLSCSTPSDVGKCSLDVTTAPAVTGVRLGMSIDEIKVKVPAVEVSGDRTEKASGSLRGSGDGSIKGVSHADFSFFENRLYSIEVEYDWDNWTAEEFKDSVAQKLSLKPVWIEPRESVFYPGWRCRCKGFEIEIFGPDQHTYEGRLVLSGPKIKLRDTVTAAIIDDRSRKADEDKRKQLQREFKP